MQFILALAAVGRKGALTRIILSMVIVSTLVCGCSSVISNSENFYKNIPRRPINWREYLSD